MAEWMMDYWIIDWWIDGGGGILECWILDAGSADERRKERKGKLSGKLCVFLNRFGFCF